MRCTVSFGNVLRVGAVVLLLGATTEAQPLADVSPTAPNAAMSLDSEWRDSDAPDDDIDAATVEPGSGTNRDPQPKRDETIIKRAVAPTRTAVPETPWYRQGIVSLAIVLATIVGVALLARRLLVKTGVASDEVLRVLRRTHLSPKQSIVLVQMGGRFAFVGVTPERISNLRVVEDAEEAAALRVQLRVEKLKAAGDGFATVLAERSDDIADHLEPEMADASPGGDSLTRTREDLQNLLGKLRSHAKSLKAEKQNGAAIPRGGAPSRTT